MAPGQLSWVYSCFASLKQHEQLESGPTCLKSVIFSSLWANTIIFLHFTSLFITMWNSNRLWSLLLKEVIPRVLSCQLEVTVGWLLWLVTTFWAASVLSTKFWKYIAVFLIHEQLQQLIPLCVHCPAFCYSQSWLVFIILISQALVPYLFDCLFFVLLVKNTQTTNWGIFVCLFVADFWMRLLNRFSARAKSLYLPFN